MTTLDEQNEKEIRDLLKSALAPMQDTELRRDLWPTMLRRLDQPPIRVPWWDWALLAAATSAFFLYPGMIPALLYHL
jgi:hypothetical protein